MKNKILIISAMLALFMANCVLSDPVRLSEADNGRTNSVKAGGDIEIVLTGNPTTGYEWGVGSFASNKLQQVGSVEYRQDKQPGRNLMVGVGGKFIFKFKAVQQGEGNIRLIYRRSWETTACDKVYSVVIDIKKD